MAEASSPPVQLQSSARSQRLLVVFAGHPLFNVQCSVFKIQCNYDASRLLQYSAHNVLCGIATYVGSHAVRVHTYLMEVLTLPARMHIDRRLVPMW